MIDELSRLKGNSVINNLQLQETHEELGTSLSAVHLAVSAPDAPVRPSVGSSTSEAQGLSSCACFSRTQWKTVCPDQHLHKGRAHHSHIIAHVICRGAL